MKPIHALAIMGALAAGPALAQEYPSGPVGQPQTGQVQSQRPEAVIMGVEIPEQAVQPEFMAQIQQQLQAEGHYRGPIDGIFGDRTQAALAAWQREQGIQPTGQLNAQTLAAMDVDALAQQQPQTAEMPQATTEPRAQTTAPLDEQQARQAEDDAINLETLRDETMSSPNLEDEAVPERPGTGAAAPGVPAERLEQPPQD